MLLSIDQLCCAGKCLRSFHPKCLGLSNVDVDRLLRRADIPYVCSDCSLGVQRCFSCQEFGMEEELFRCGIAFCGKFFHESCLPKTAEESSQGITLVCPLHTCHNCGKTPPNIHEAKKRSRIWRCFRCPKAYDLLHRPRDVHVLASGLFLCIEHTLEEESWPEVPSELIERVEQMRKRKLVGIYF